MHAIIINDKVVLVVSCDVLVARTRRLPTPRALFFICIQKYEKKVEEI